MAPAGTAWRWRASKNEGRAGAAKAKASDLVIALENSRRENLKLGTLAPGRRISANHTLRRRGQQQSLGRRGWQLRRKRSRSKSGPHRKRRTTIRRCADNLRKR